MISRLLFIVTVGCSFSSCTSKEKKMNDEISGTYVKEYSFVVTNPESGNEIGVRTIRDTIFIDLAENGYKVSNRKWKLNEYDKEGWQNMEHDEDRSIPTFTAKFDSEKKALIDGSDQKFFLNGNSIAKQRNDKHPYSKIYQERD